MVSTDVDTSKVYRVEGYGGVAWRCRGPVMVRDEDFDWTGIEEPDERQVQMVMVGDDKVWHFDCDDLEELDELDYCHVCGQIGCAHDGLDRG